MHFIYFSGCNNLNDVKQQYRKLAMQHHPDKGGDPATFRAVTEEYDQAVKYFAKYGPKDAAGTHTEEQASPEDQQHTIFENAQYKAAIDAIIHIEGINIEVVGSWVWVTGNTYPHKATIKAAGYLFASAKKAWYFRTEENRTTRSKKGTTLDEIKNKYGSQTVNNYKPASRLSAHAA